MLKHNLPGNRVFHFLNGLLESLVESGSEEAACFCLHAVIAGNAISVGVRKDMTHMQGTTHGGRRSINAVDLGPVSTTIKSVKVASFPTI